MIYLDYAANTPVDKRVLDRFNEITLDFYGNPNSMHSEGIKAKNLIDSASESIASYFNTKKGSIIYTSGSSESNNLVIKGLADRLKTKGKHIIISEIEHSSIIAPCNYLSSLGFDISVIPLDENGIVDLKKLEKEIRNDTILVSITSVDSELGTIQPINEIVKIVKKHNIIFHTDATQAVGKTNINYDGVDFLTFAPHKFYGLNGIGVLINFNNIKLTPLIHGGKSTTIYRSGTPVTANIVSCAYALELIMANLDNNINYISNLKKMLINNIKKIEKVHINSPEKSVDNILNISIANASDIVDKLYEKNICVSKQSACSLNTSPSKSVYAITKDKFLASNSIRISLSHLTTKEEIEKFLIIFKELVNENNNN